MRLIDELKIKLCSGKGGDGIVSWLRLKNMPKGGPAGGDGGKGGDVYIKAVKDITALRKYAGIKELKAEDGKPGQSRGKKGESGDDLVLELPVGSVIKLDDKEIDLLEPGQTVKILDGGIGGLGNINFKSSRNRAPRKATKGKPAQCVDAHIELRVIADVGFVGKPNAGKSSLLNALSNSKARVGDYPFTTVEPNLAVLDNIVLADIPGLIEGASEGKGLGFKFLKHISRTKLLLHLISAEYENPVNIYSLIRDELKKYDKSLAQKPELVVISKLDLIDGLRQQKILEDFEQIGIQPVFVSVNLPDSIEDLKIRIKQSLKQVQ